MKIPLDIPKSARHVFSSNYKIATHNTDNLMLLAGDQRVEHLHSDFFGEGISIQDADPVHLFNIASKARIGLFATQLGFISRYGMDFKKVNYLVKLNSKTNLLKNHDPFSEMLVDVPQVVEFAKNSRLNICAVGYTLYLGSEFEPEMLREASQVVLEAHNSGLLAVLWIYPRGKSIKSEKDGKLITGAAGVGAALGADFVKVNYPVGKDADSWFKKAVVSAGRTGIVCAGGSSKSPKAFLQDLSKQISNGGRGSATGRNVHQKNLDDAVRMCNAISSIVIDGSSVDKAYKIFKG